MKIRKLEDKDAPLMLEWMHDDSVVHYMQSNFAAKSLDDCLAFIKKAQYETESLHRAIVDDNDEYMGTVSLKDIHKNSAEFAITIRKCAMGKGYSAFGMSEIIREGFSRGLKRIYWCVAPENRRAVRFYDKNGYCRCKAPDNLENYTKSQIDHYIWYEVK